MGESNTIVGNLINEYNNTGVLNNTIAIGASSTVTNNTITIGNGIANTIENTAVINKQFAGSNQLPTGSSLSVIETSNIATPMTNYSTPEIDQNAYTETVLALPPNTIFFPISVIIYMVQIGVGGTSQITITNTSGGDQIINGINMNLTNPNYIFANVLSNVVPPISNSIIITTTGGGSGTMRVCIQGFLQQI